MVVDERWETIMTSPGLHRVSNLSIVCASVLLIGVIVLGIGYFRSDQLTVYAGLILTGAGVLTCLMSTVIPLQRKNVKTRAGGREHLNG
jgi:hypothetical protein